jgi:hypothetical protein
MSRRLAAASFLAVTTVTAAMAHAQIVGTLDAGTGHVTYHDTPRMSVVSLTPAVVFEGERTNMSAVGAFTRFEGGIWSAQALAAGSRFTEARGPFRGEFSGQFETNSHRETVRASQVLAHARAHLIGAGDHGFWLGAGGGYAWREPASGTVVRADAGAWAQLWDATARLTASHNSVETGTRTVAAASPNFELASTKSSLVTDVAMARVRYVDAEASLAWARGRVALDAAAGRRMVQGGITTNTWLLGGSVALTERLALVASAGASPFDIAQGLPGGEYATIALRLTTSPGRALEMHSRSRATANDLATSREEDGTILLVVHAPRARRVELMGDFTDWKPLVMQREADGYFAARVRLPAGSYRINVRVDGGEWTAPPGTTPVADEYNGAAGLLVIGTE